MNNKFGTILYTIFLTIFLIVGTKGYAQRDIQVFEPDFNKDYAIHLGLYSDLKDEVYPNTYIEFYSDYARKHKVKKTVSFLHDKWNNTIYYNKDGYIIRTERIAKDTLIYTYKYSNHNRTITRYLNNDRRIFKTYYFNEMYVLDSTSIMFLAMDVQKSHNGADSVVHVIMHDKVKYIYCENGLLATASSYLYKNINIEYLIPGTNIIGAESAKSHVPFKININTQPKRDSIGYFYPIELFKQKENDSKEAYLTTTWSTNYFTSVRDNKYNHNIELRQRPDYMLIETSNQYQQHSTTASNFYEWNAKGKLMIYSKYEIGFSGGFELSRKGVSCTRVSGGWEVKEVGFSTYENSFKIRVSKKGIFGGEWMIKYFK